jgi:DNA-binding NtrC family response regulator
MRKNWAAAAPPKLIGDSPQIGAVRRLIDKAARNRLPVLLLGPSGTGKEVVARSIYHANPVGEFVPIDCGSLVGTLMESELFGHVKGAFSGATDNKKGLVEIADGGTAFFDEIGDLPLETQVKLLRLIQEREFRPVGALHWRKIDLRIIAATHRDLKEEVERGKFRLDLFYRLNVFPIRLPALEERREDIPALVDHFLEQADEVLPLSPETLALLEAYDWPGNVRELQHCVERMVALRSEGVLRMSDMPSALQTHAAAMEVRRLADAVGSEDYLPEVHRVPASPVISLPETERQAIAAALAANHGERGKTARLLQISRTTLYRKMKEYRLG